jgi:hypothetical protein
MTAKSSTSAAKAKWGRINERRAPTALMTPIRLVWQKDEDEAAFRLKLQKAHEAKFAALVGHYNLLDPASMFAGLMALADDFIPGFRIDVKFEMPGKKRGRHAEWETDARLMLSRAMFEKFYPPRKASAEAVKHVLAEDIAARDHGNRSEHEYALKRQRALQNRISKLASQDHRAAGQMLLDDLEKNYASKFEKV